MGDDSKTVDQFEPLMFIHVPKDGDGNSTIDLFVYLPSSHEYVMFVSKGEVFTEHRRQALLAHVVPMLFVKHADLIKLPATVAANRPITSQELNLLGHGTTKALSQVYEALKEGSVSTPEESMAVLSQISEKVIATLAPETQSLRERLTQSLNCLWLMDDAAALTTLAVFMATANGLDSKRSLRELVPACLLMDLPLLKLGAEKISQLRKNLPGPTAEEAEQYRNHPVVSHQLAKKGLATVTEGTLELILFHHERNDGSGFPRAVRSSTLFPMARVLAAAVDVFDQLKSALEDKIPGMGLKQILELLMEPGVEPHKRKHQQNIIQKSLLSLQSEAPTC